VADGDVAIHPPAGVTGRAQRGDIRLPDPVVFGAAYSVYVRTVRLALVEKGVPYHVVEVDVFASGGPPTEHLARQPFGRIPAFEHDGFRLYEAGAITRYVDEAFDGPPLQPNEAKRRARMNQIISVLDSYAYRTLVWDIFVERVRAPSQGRAPDEARIAAALPRAEVCVQALEELMGEQKWLAGTEPTLADLHAAPMFAYFRLARQGRDLMARHPGITRWWHAMGARDSMTATRSPPE
jgi:glutathione S-transferase